MCSFQRKVQGVDIPSMSFLFWLVKLNVKNKCDFKGRLGLSFTLFKMVLKIALDERDFLYITFPCFIYTP